MEVKVAPIPPPVIDSQVAIVHPPWRSNRKTWAATKDGTSERGPTTQPCVSGGASFPGPNELAGIGCQLPSINVTGAPAATEARRNFAASFK